MYCTSPENSYSTLTPSWILINGFHAMPFKSADTLTHWLSAIFLWIFFLSDINVYCCQYALTVLAENWCFVLKQSEKSFKNNKFLFGLFLWRLLLDLYPKPGFNFFWLKIYLSLKRGVLRDCLPGIWILAEATMYGVRREILLVIFFLFWFSLTCWFGVHVFFASTYFPLFPMKWA